MLRYASMVYAVVVCLSVSPSVTTCRTISKQRNVESRKQCHTIVLGLSSFLMPNS